jgi:hypothetical protein
MARQVFAKAFKLEAARLLDAGKQPTVPIARELRLEREKFYAWLARLREKGPDVFRDRPGCPAAGDSAEAKRLNPELERVTENWPASTRSRAFARRWSYRAAPIMSGWRASRAPARFQYRQLFQPWAAAWGATATPIVQ